MIIKHVLKAFSPTLEVDAKTFGTVTSLEDLKNQLNDIVFEQHEVDVLFNQAHLEEFFHELKIAGKVDDNMGEDE